MCFKWIYLGLLALQFILALGNRPKGERMAYLLTLIVYAILSLYLIICSIYLTVKSFASLDFKSQPTFGDKFAYLVSGTSGVLLAALVATFGIYLFSSLLYRDPWHIFTSMPQYLLMAPSFTNVIQVYAFNNLHDVSWGTKGSDKAEVLPSVSSSKAQGDAPAIVEDTAKVQEDIDSAFQETVTRAVAKIKKEETVEKPTMDDENKTFRTRLVAAWMLSNAALAVAIETLNGTSSDDPKKDAAALQSKQHIYFSIILWTTFGLSMVRFIGCLYYFFRRNLFRWCRRN